MIARTNLMEIIGTYVLSVVAGVVAVALNRWFGSSDLLPFAIYCIPFSLAVAPAVGLVFAVTRRIPIYLAILIAFLAGLSFGWLATLVVAFILGPWFGAMSVPILQVWAVTSAFVLSAGVLFRRRSLSPRTAAVLACLAAISVFTSVLFRPVLSFATENQHLTVFFFRHQPGSVELSIEDADSLDPADIALLKQTGFHGTLQGRGSHASNNTEWPRAKVFFIFTSPLTVPASLPQPKHCSIVYVQDGSSFRRVPSDAPTFSRQIHLEPGSGNWHLVVEHSNGARSGGSVSP
jgi:hypothetical protein